MEANALATLIDEYATQRDARLDLDRAAKKAREAEQQLAGQIIEALQEAGLSSAGGDHAVVKLKSMDKPIVRDWAALYDYIRDNEAFDLLHRRLTEAAVRERTEQGENVPGLGVFPITTITVSKV